MVALQIIWHGVHSVKSHLHIQTANEFFWMIFVEVKGQFGQVFPVLWLVLSSLILRHTILWRHGHNYCAFCIEVIPLFHTQKRIICLKGQRLKVIIFLMTFKNMKICVSWLKSAPGTRDSSWRYVSECVCLNSVTNCQNVMDEHKNRVKSSTPPHYSLSHLRSASP